MSLAIGPSELSLVLLILCAVVIPVAAIAFARSGKGLDNLGKGTFAIDRESPSSRGSAPPAATPAEHEAEVRQMVEASAWRRRERGEGELDVQAEINRLLGLDPDEAAALSLPGTAGETGPDTGASTSQSDQQPGDHEIREEIRQLIVANNERRERRGEDPLDVEAEIERRVREWT